MEVKLALYEETLSSGKFEKNRRILYKFPTR